MLEGCCARSTTYGLPYVALRYFNVYGPRMDIGRQAPKCSFAGWNGSIPASRR